MKRGRKLNFYFALYTSDDELVTVIEDYKELANYLGKTYRSIQSTISRIKRGKVKETIDNEGKRYKIYLMKR